MWQRIQQPNFRTSVLVPHEEFQISSSSWCEHYLVYLHHSVLSFGNVEPGLDLDPHRWDKSRKNVCLFTLELSENREQSSKVYGCKHSWKFERPRLFKPLVKKILLFGNMKSFGGMSEQIKEVDPASVGPGSWNYIDCNFLPLAYLVFMSSAWWTHSLGCAESSHHRHARQKGVSAGMMMNLQSPPVLPSQKCH